MGFLPLGFLYLPSITIQAIDAKCFASCGILMFGIGVWEFQLNREGWGLGVVC